MAPLKFKFMSTARVVSITLGFIALLLVAIQGYIKGDFDALSISVMVLIALNVFYMFIAKPHQPDEFNTNGDSQEA